MNEPRRGDGRSGNARQTRGVAAQAARAEGVALLLLLLLSALPAFAQDQPPSTVAPIKDPDVTRGHSRDLIPGVQSIEISKLARDGSWEATMLSIERNVGPTTADVVVAPEGPWNSVPLVEAALQASSAGAFALVTPPGLNDAPIPTGIQFAKETIWAWPGKVPLLIARPEGTWGFADPVETRGVVVADDGTSIPLASVNGAPRDGGVGIVCGALDGREAGALLWPESTLAIPMSPGPDNKDAGPSMWDASLSRDARKWQLGNPAPVRTMRLGAGEWTLLLPEDASPGTRAALSKARSVRIEIELPPIIEQSSWTMPVGSWLMRDGKSAAENDAPEDATFWGFAAINQRGDTLWVGESGGGQRGQRPFDRGDMMGLLLKQSAWNAVALTAGPRRLLPDVATEMRKAGGPSIPAQVALLPRPGVPLVMRGETNSWRLLPVAIANGSNVLDERNGPHALIDGETGPDPAAKSYWSADHSTDPRGAGGAWFELRLVAPMRVSAIDLLHVEMCGFSPQFDLRAFRVLGRARASEPWQALATVAHDKPVPRERLRLEKPTMLETIRVEVTEPNFTGGATARLAEVLIWGEEVDAAAMRRRTPR